MNPTDSIFHEAISKLLIEVFEGPPGDEAYVLNPGDPGLLRQLETFPRQSRQPLPHLQSRRSRLTSISARSARFWQWPGPENQNSPGVVGLNGMPRCS